MKGFANAKVYIRGKGVVRADIAVENGRIARISPPSQSVEPIAETGDCLLVAGFIDEHIHGAGGFDVMDGTQAALTAVSDTLVKEGTTSFLATTMTCRADDIKKSLKAVAEFKRRRGARILGVHLEGPFISREYLGAQAEEHIQYPSNETFSDFLSASGSNIKIVTLAPEQAGAERLIKYIEGLGITVSAGHSGASAEQIADAMDCGLTCITHTFNAQSPLRHREIGTAGAALLFDGLCCELIADTVHVSVPAIKLLLKNKPKDKVVLITDAMRAKGLSDGVSELGGQTVYVKDGQARLKNGSLAGSVLKMNTAVKNLVEKCGCSVEYALDCATYNPAKNLGLEKEYGVIQPGAAADFTLLDSAFNVVLTVVGGEVVYTVG
ncbi:MAG: N-acetylglucosamine-6-phosphate deacetylase [Clostridia bacterium]|nr:N-acetylglucosamine-6-phosphate deacetylase [Clostridia bacterium]